MSRAAIVLCITILQAGNYPIQPPFGCRAVCRVVASSLWFFAPGDVFVCDMSTVSNARPLSHRGCDPELRIRSIHTHRIHKSSNPRGSRSQLPPKRSDKTRFLKYIEAFTKLGETDPYFDIPRHALSLNYSALTPKFQYLILSPA